MGRRGNELQQLILFLLLPPATSMSAMSGSVVSSTAAIHFWQVIIIIIIFLLLFFFFLDSLSLLYCLVLNINFQFQKKTRQIHNTKPLGRSVSMRCSLIVVMSSMRISLISVNFLI